MTKRISQIVLAALLVLSASKGAEAIVVVASHVDPAVGPSGSPNLFTFTAGATGNDITGATFAQSTEGLTAVVDLALLGIVGTTEAYFTFPTLTATGVFNGLAGGYQFDAPGLQALNFYDNATDDLLLTINFDYVFVNVAGVGGSDLIAGNVVNFTYPGWTFTDPEQFAYSFSSGQLALALAFAAGGGAQANVTASFTSSANTAERDIPVPEPTSMLLLGTGLVGVASRLRRRNKA